MKLRLNKLKFYCFVLLTFTSCTLSAQTINTDRPDQTESSLVIPANSFQIESGTLLQISQNGDQLQILAPTNLIRVNIVKGIELRVLNQLEMNRYQWFIGEPRNQWGISDIQLGTKVQLYNVEESNTSVAFLAHAIFPTGTNTNPNNPINWITKLCISHNFNNSINLGYNLGFDRTRDQNILTYSVSFAKGVTDKFGFFAEIYGDFYERISDNELITNEKLDAGVTYLLRDNFQLDFSFGLGISDQTNFISTGFSWNIAQR